MRTTAGVTRRILGLVAVLGLLVGCSSAPADDEPPVRPEVGQDVDPSTRDDPAPDDAQPGTDGRSGEDDVDDGPPLPEEGTDPVPPEPAAVPEPPADRPALVGQAEQLLAAALAEADGGDVAVLVLDEHGREVVAHRADDAVLPASTLKIVTAAAALTTFGPDARFRTRVEATAPVGGDGVLDGDLVLVGSGDPVLATEEYGRWVYPARPRTPLEELADAVVANGIREVRGDLVGVADGFDGPNVADGWPDRYFSSLDARYAAGLSVDAGLRTILTYPEPEGSADGDSDTDADSDTDPEPEPSDPPGSDALEEESDDDPPPDVDPIVRVDHAADPAIHAAEEFGRLLRDRGVTIRGDARAGEPNGAIVGRMARIESPPLHDLLRFAVQRSDNQITDALFRAVGRARTGTGSFASGDRALRQVLDRFGIDHAGARFADGSGLSREDRATARLLVELDRAMLRSRHGSTWTSLMAVTGRSGTLESRLQGTIADGRFAGKTGTLRDVTALVGTVHTRGSRRYHLAVIANDPGGARWISRALADELIILLAADLEGCTARTSDGADGTLGIPPLAVAC